MTKRMLIDATHEEETRVAVVDDNNNRLLEFDYENKFRKPLKGSIFLAKVTRVEPSLQAAFVNFGGNRHGFLPFSEIHPDYYRIPISDREALLAEQEALLAEEAEREEAEDMEDAVSVDQGEEAAAQDDDHLDDVEEIGNSSADLGDEDEDGAEAADKGERRGGRNRGRRGRGRGRKSGDDRAETGEDHIAASDEDEHDDVDGNRADAEDVLDGDESSEGADNGESGGENDDRGNNRRRFRRGGRSSGRGRRGRNAQHRSRQVEVLGGTEYEDEEGNASDRFRYNLRRQYKIQEVIKRGQIMLIQVSREERGNKGAAVSTYLSLPGRYGVLMPNSPRAGGVSRKIAKFEDRQRMRETLKEMDVPKGMSVILRTAGVTRTKTEIKRDVDYLMRLWDDIREKTLQSSAPALIYEEADLIKRAVRDLYGRDVEEIQVAGTEGFENTKKFMKMMIPSHVKKVKEYKSDKVPLFHRFRIENQISEINETTAKLKSGGYLVINPTEALVSIDVNSGRATKERHIEETALNTNLEAAEEVARQLRLRDLGGLVVIDFIDMEDRRNNARVERRLKEALAGDRARIQIGRISSFGLLELSRQRLNPSLTEAQYDVCKHCEGRGVVRNCDTTSIMLLRSLEEEGIKARAAQLIVHVSSEVAIYILNNKRRHLDEIEARYGFSVLLRTDDTLGMDKFRVEVARPLEDYNPEEAAGATDNQAVDGEDDERGNGGRRKRGRRGGRGRSGRNRDGFDRRDDDAGRDSHDASDSGDYDDAEDDAGETAGRQESRENGREDGEDSGRRDRDRRRRRSSRRSGQSRTEDESGDARAERPVKAEVATDDAAPADERPAKKAAAKSSAPKKVQDAPVAEEKAKAGAVAEDKSDAKADVAKPAKETKAKAVKAAKASDKGEAEEKAPKAGKATKSAKKDSLPEASNDTPAKAPKNIVDPAAYEKVNEEPKSKKKGWWNKLVE